MDESVWGTADCKACPCSRISEQNGANANACSRRHRQAAFSHHLPQLPVTQLLADVLSKVSGDEDAAKVAAFEKMIGECHSHDADFPQSTLFAPEPNDITLRCRQ
jgi:hypothetical protein